MLGVGISVGTHEQFAGGVEFDGIVGIGGMLGVGISVGATVQLHSVG